MNSHLSLEIKEFITEFVNDFVVGDRRLAERRDLFVSAGGVNSRPRGKTDERCRLVIDGTGTFRREMLGGEFYKGSLRGVPADPSHLLFVFADPGTLRRDDHRLLALLSQLLFLLQVTGTPDLSIWQSRSGGSLLRRLRETAALSQSALADQLGTSRICVSLWESSAQIPSRQKVYDLCRVLGLVCPPKTALVQVVDFSPELLRFLQEDPARLRSLTPDQFERFVAERMDRMGYNVRLTGATNRKDGGIDLIAVPKLANVGSHIIAGQVKHHRGDQTTGRDAVDRLLAWKDSYFGVGLLVTNTSFTRDAVWTTQQERNARFLRLRDFNDLKRWLEDRYGEEQDWREIPERIELAPGVVIEIPRPRFTSVSLDRSILRDNAPGKPSGRKR